MDTSIGWVAIHMMLLLPYLAAILLIQIGKIRIGMALLVVWAPITSLWVIPTFLESATTDVYYNIGSIMLYRWGFFFFLLQLALALGAGFAYFRFKTAGKGSLLGIAIGTFPYIALILLVGRNSWPIDHFPQMGGASQIGYLRLLNSAEVTYANTYGRGFSTSLAALGDPAPGLKPNDSAAGLINEFLASGIAVGYTFAYAHGLPNSDGKIRTYILSARPIRRTCGSNYSTDQSGLIRRTADDRPATLQDPPLPGSGGN